jgi:hypothetical protein
MVEVETNGGGEMADAEHAHEGSSIFHVRECYAPLASVERCE